MEVAASRTSANPSAGTATETRLPANPTAQ